jgi:hypothetical protein
MNKNKTAKTVKPQLVQFHDCVTGENYSVRFEKDCKDSTDKSIYREVIRLNDVITMGKTIAWPSA